MSDGSINCEVFKYVLKDFQKRGMKMYRRNVVCLEVMKYFMRTVREGEIGGLSRVRVCQCV